MDIHISIETKDNPHMTIAIFPIEFTNNHEFVVDGEDGYTMGGIIFNHEGTGLELVQKVLTSVIGK